MQTFFTQRLNQNLSAGEFKICVLQFVFVKELRSVSTVISVGETILLFEALVTSGAAESCHSGSK
jgi:hypothetical protein